MTTASGRPPPLIIRMALADDWPAAAALALAETMPALPDAAEAAAAVMTPLDWSSRRRHAAWFVDRLRQDARHDVADAWAMLAADPRGWQHGHREYEAVFRGLARAVVERGELLDDDAVVEMIDGWRFIERAGTDGVMDVVAAARWYGEMCAVAKAREFLPVWARSWARHDADLALSARGQKGS